MHENMTRNKGWAFLDMGRRIERAGNMSEAILWLFGQPLEREEETGRLFFLLEVADSFITYRSRYRLDPMLALVLDLLLLDETNPRSLAYQLASISAAPRRLAAVEAGREPHGRAPHHPLDADVDTPRRRRSASPRTRRASSCRAPCSQQLHLLPAAHRRPSSVATSISRGQPHRVHTRLEPKS